MMTLIFCFSTQSSWFPTYYWSENFHCNGQVLMSFVQCIPSPFCSEIFSVRCCSFNEVFIPLHNSSLSHCLYPHFYHIYLVLCEKAVFLEALVFINVLKAWCVYERTRWVLTAFIQGSPQQTLHQLPY